MHLQKALARSVTSGPGGSTKVGGATYEGAQGLSHLCFNGASLFNRLSLLSGIVPEKTFRQLKATHSCKDMVAIVPENKIKTALWCGGFVGSSLFEE